MAKDALESFLPRLKDMLEQSGLALNNANVSQQGEGKNSFNLADQSASDSFDTDLAEGSASSTSRQEKSPPL